MKYNIKIYNFDMIMLEVLQKIFGHKLEQKPPQSMIANRLLFDS